MSVLDDVIAAIAPAESEQARLEARGRAQAIAGRTGWLAMVLEQHILLEEGFADVKAAADPIVRLAEHRRLATILTAHCVTEERVLYPALAAVGGNSGARTACRDQADAQLDMGLLERLPPMSAQYEEKLERLRLSVAHHLYKEEDGWLIVLAGRTSIDEQRWLTQRYREQFEQCIAMCSPGMSALATR